MPFTKHRLQEIKEGNLRARCTICGQAWTSYDVRSACPGVPVYPFEETPSYLKTLTALERERKYPPDPEQWDGAYRILKAPYYRLLYDERKAEHRPLTEKQLAARDKQKATMRARYGCRLCDTYYRKEDQRWFRDGVCSRCQSAARSWNQLIDWARRLVVEQPLILDIFTEPAVRPIAFLGSAPNCYYDQATNKHLIEWWKPETYLLTGYQVMSLVTGELERKVEQLAREADVFELQHLISPQASALVPPPFVLMVSEVTADIVYHAVSRGTKRERSANLETLPRGYSYHARTGRAWTRILEVDSRGLDEREHLEKACVACGATISEKDSTAALLRKLVLRLAAQEPIAIQELGSHDRSSAHTPR